MERQDIEKFYQHLLNNQIPENVHQEAAGYGSKRYTADMWTLEVCECLLGMDCKKFPYRNQKLDLFTSLKKVMNDANAICVGEVGRGLDILIANMLKKWKVICYDHNPIYAEYLDKYFKDYKFHPISTHGFIANVSNHIKEKTIFIIDNTKCRDFKKLEENENIVHLIFYGRLLW